MTVHVGAIVLAAGFSTRFGGTKLTAALANGQRVAQQTVQQLTRAAIHTVVITRTDLLAALALEEHPLLNCLSFDAAEQGMGATLAFGIHAADAWDACLVCLADMPFITADTYTRIASAAAVNRIIIPTFGPRDGNPVAFGRDFFPELKALQGDSGGRTLISRHAPAVTRLALNDPAILADIDTPDDLTRHQS